MTAYAAYQEAEILSSTPEQLVLLLYRRLLGHLRQGADCLDESDIAGKGEHFQKASAILYELAASLDHEVGGDLAGQLSALYAFFIREIAAASMAKSRSRIERVIVMVEQLNQSWISAAREIGEAAATGG
ncbi:MAG: flagellar export chaperone FliS [Gemmatimonadetes bacterium]|nr:flagellar export chaperone FliS [Gemmatimonadota bacterium]